MEEKQKGVRTLVNEFESAAITVGCICQLIPRGELLQLPSPSLRNLQCIIKFPSLHFSEIRHNHENCLQPSIQINCPESPPFPLLANPKP